MGNLLLRQWPVSLDQSGQNDQQSGQDLFWMALLGWTAADAGCLGPHLLTWLQGPVSVLSPVLLPLWTGTRRACQQNMLWVQGTCAENHKHHPQTGPVITVACLTNITCYDTIFFYSFLIIQIHTNIQTSKSTGVLRPVNRCGYIRTKIYRRTDRQKDKRAKEKETGNCTNEPLSKCFTDFVQRIALLQYIADHIFFKWAVNVMLCLCI